MPRWGDDDSKGVSAVCLSLRLCWLRSLFPRGLTLSPPTSHLVVHVLSQHTRLIDLCQYQPRNHKQRLVQSAPQAMTEGLQTPSPLPPAPAGPCSAPCFHLYLLLLLIWASIFSESNKLSSAYVAVMQHLTLLEGNGRTRASQSLCSFFACVCLCASVCVPDSSVFMLWLWKSC